MEGGLNVTVSPPKRMLMGMTSARGMLYVFGGKNDSKCLSDLYRFDPSTRSWDDLSHAMTGSIPAPRQHLGFEAAGEDKLFLFGGQCLSGKRNAVVLGWVASMCMLTPIEMTGRQDQGSTTFTGWTWLP